MAELSVVAVTTARKADMPKKMKACADGGLIKEGRETYKDKKSMKEHEAAESPERERLEESKSNSRDYRKK